MIPRQFRIHAVLILACAVIIIFPLLSERPEGYKAEEAKAAAAEFLTLTDAGRFGAAWEASAAVLKEKIGREEWNRHLEGSRAKTGPVAKRGEPNASYAQMAQESDTEGEYVVLVYPADFERQKGLSETVTVMLEGDSAWRVAGYFIE